MSAAPATPCLALSIINTRTEAQARLANTIAKLRLRAAKRRAGGYQNVPLHLRDLEILIAAADTLVTP